MRNVRSSRVDEWPSSLDIQMLCPPYDAFSPVAALEAVDPPVGTVVCADGRGSEASTLAGIAALTLARHRWPWIVPGLVAGHVPGWVETEVEWFPDWRCVLARDTASAVIAVTPRTVLELVRARAVPPPSLLGEFVGVRLGSHDLADLLTEQFAALAAGTVPRRSSAFYSRHLARLGSWNARDWRIVGRMALRVAGWSGRDSADPRTWMTRSRKYLGCSWDVARPMAGWESVLELAVRRHGPLNPP